MKENEQPYKQASKERKLEGKMGVGKGGERDKRGKQDRRKSKIKGV